MIEASDLTKRYGDKLAVDHLSFAVRPGQVTGFLGPNGAGKSTTMRMILGLDAPTSGTVTVNGRPYAAADHPMREVGALLDAKAIHGGRSAYHHLLCLAQTNGLPSRRVGEVLEMVGLSEVARKRSKGFSLGMGQRLGIAAALLGDPQVLMFDEPVNGLDPEGILWIRQLMKALAAQGRTVFVSSHLMSEMENTADHLLVIGRGKLIADCTVAEFIARNSELQVRVRTPEAGKLADLIAAAGGRATSDSSDGTALVVVGLRSSGSATSRSTTASGCTSSPRCRLPWRRRSWSSPRKASSTTPRCPAPSARRSRPDMTTVTAAPVPGATLPAPSGRSGFLGALRSEWTKIRSVRSTMWTLLATMVVTIGFSTLIAAGRSGHIGSEDLADFDPVRFSMFGIVLGQLVIVVIGAMTVSSEYSTGMIRTSLTSMPRRGVVYSAKLAVFTVVALVTGLVCSFASFFIGQVFYSNVTVRNFGNDGVETDVKQNLSVTLSQHHVLQAVIGGGLYLTVSSLLAFGLAALLRHTAGAITAAIALLFVSSILVNFLPQSWARNVDRWIPFFAGGQIWGVRKLGDPGTPMFSPWAGIGVFAAYAAVAIIAGFLLFRKRDA